MKRFLCMLCGVMVAGLITLAGADTLTVKGTVKSSATGTPAINGAVVTVQIMGGTGGGTSILDTTDALGAYSVKTVVTGNSTTLLVSAVATGFQIGNPNYQTVQNTNNGTSDSAIVNISLIPNGQTVTPDSLYILGVVRVVPATPLAGATVSAQLGNFGNPVTAITDALGNYRIAARNPAQGTSMVILTVTATGYSDTATAFNAHTFTIQNPRDGTPDTITGNFYVEAIPQDTIKVSGTVVDSSNNHAISGANAIISFAVNGTTYRDTAVTNTNGIFTLNMLKDLGTNISQNRVTWIMEKTGYASKTGNRTITNNIAAIDTVKLVAYTTQDSVTYTVSGRITGDAGVRINGAQVIVSISHGGSVFYLDTVQTNNQGNYTTAPGKKVPYVTGDNVIVVRASSTAYRTDSLTQTVVTSTSAIAANIQLTLLNTSIRNWIDVGPVISYVDVAIYSTNGKLIKIISGISSALVENQIKQLLNGNQPVIVQIRNGATVINQKMVRIER